MILVRTMKKTVKQYSYLIEKNVIKELLLIGNRYKKVKNYVYARFSGIRSLLLVQNDRKIRDVWVKSEFANQWKLPARYWKLALTEAIGNIKTNWTTIKKKIREHAKANEHLTNTDLHYIRYILKADHLYYQVLNRIPFEVPKKFQDKELNRTYLHNLICRYTRKYKGRIPRVNETKHSFSVDTGLYRYKQGTIHLTSLRKGKRIAIPLTEKNEYHSTLKIIVNAIRHTIEVHCPIDTKIRKIKGDNVIGIDKGYRYLFATSTDHMYGEKLSMYLSEETERLKQVNASRNRFYALYRMYKKQGNETKANRILQHNLGKRKYQKNKKKHDGQVKSYINEQLNRLIQEEQPKEIIMEQLDFVSWNARYPKHVKRKLCRWLKGYIRERVEYKCELYDIVYTNINPAYTSKICHNCCAFGKRNGDTFVCKQCGTFHADINAAKNIYARKYDEEINLYTNYKKVKEILNKRNGIAIT